MKRVGVDVVILSVVYGSLFFIGCTPSGEPEFSNSNSVSTPITGGGQNAPLPDTGTGIGTGTGTTTPPASDTGSGNNNSTPETPSLPNLNRNLIQLVTIEGNSTDEFFGTDIATANLDGDAYADVIIAAKPRLNVAQTACRNSGNIYIFYGKNLKDKASQKISYSTYDKVIQGVGGLNDHGTYKTCEISFLGVGKFSDSVKDDLFIRDLTNSKVYIFTKAKLDPSISAQKTIQLSEAAYSIIGRLDINNSRGFFGMGLALADLNQDAKNELLISAPTYNSSLFLSDGALYMYQLSNLSLGLNDSSVAQRMISGSYKSAWTGMHLVNVGDINGDLQDDIAFTTALLSSVRTGKMSLLGGFPGRNLFLGNYTDLNSLSLFVFSNQTTKDNMAPKVLGDINDDGKKDFGYDSKIYYGQDGLSNTYEYGFTRTSIIRESYNRISDTTTLTTAINRPEVGADIDGDGFQDLVTVGQGPDYRYDNGFAFNIPKPSYVIWGRNNGFPSTVDISQPQEFSMQEIPIASSLNSSCSPIALHHKILAADVNGDTAKDLIIASPDVHWTDRLLEPGGNGCVFIRRNVK